MKEEEEPTATTTGTTQHSHLHCCSVTAVVYIQNSVSWVLGFSIPTILMFSSIVLFFLGTKFYVHVAPEGSIFSSIAQVFVAAYKKRCLNHPSEERFLYDPPVNSALASKLPLTNEYRISIQPKHCLWLSSAMRVTTKVPDLFCHVFHIQLPMVFEQIGHNRWRRPPQRRREGTSNSIHDGHPAAPLSALWLAPQLILLGFAEAINFIGQIEFYNKQFPENLRSIATSLFFCTIAGANYLSSLIVSLVHGLSGRNGKPDWLTDDINQGRIDYFYYLLPGLGIINFVYFVIAAMKFKYKKIEIVGV
ncbi:NRT1/ PTR FAMILY 2.13-like protein [Drosera capensis]